MLNIKQEGSFVLSAKVGWVVVCVFKAGTARIMICSPSHAPSIYLPWSLLIHLPRCCHPRPAAPSNPTPEP